MEVYIPSKFKRHTMYSLLESVINNDLEPKYHEVIFNFCSLDFIEPAGVTILSNLFEWLEKRGVKVTLKYPNINVLGVAPAIQFLDDSGFFKQYMGHTITMNPQVRSTTIPLKLVTYDNSYQWLRSDFTYWLAGQLDVTPESLENIAMSFGEIFNNIKDHAQEYTGCIFAQHFPKTNEVKIAISDFGVGIPNNIRKIMPKLQDHEAIAKATEDGFTSRTSPRNLGAGLYTLIANVVYDNGGAVHIHSNYGILTCTRGHTGNQVLKQPLLKNAFYPGTFIEVVLKTDTIFNITDVEEEFEW